MLIPCPTSRVQAENEEGDEEASVRISSRTTVADRATLAERVTMSEFAKAELPPKRATEATDPGISVPLIAQSGGGSSAIVHMKDAIYNNKPPPPRHMVRLLATTACLFLVLGAVLGMFLESILDATGAGLERWLLSAPEECEDGVCGPKTCEDGLLVPGPVANKLNMLMFTFLLLWSFVGVAIVADIFMVGIEVPAPAPRLLCLPSAHPAHHTRARLMGSFAALFAQVITSTEKVTMLEVNGVMRQFHVTVWNATVANLTLMALGSSAPEILLSIIEIVSSGFYAGELGPSTIVGSAAFNLLVITAVCVYAVGPEGRYIADQSVFYITASFSVFAYLWLLVILMVTTPNIIDVWEGLATFALFPLLVGLAYYADTGQLSQIFQGVGAKGSTQQPVRGTVSYMEESTTAVPQLSKDELGKLLANVNADGTDYELTEAAKKQAREAVASQLSSGQGHSRAYYRVAATRAGTGGTDMVAADAEMREARAVGGGSAYDRAGSTADIESSAATVGGAKGRAAEKPTIQFAYTALSVSEADSYVDVQVQVSNGEPTGAVSCQFDTVSGTATAGEDFEAVSGRVEFGPGVTTRLIRVPIKEDDLVEGAEMFSVVLSDASKGARVGPAAECVVTIQDNDSYGVIAFVDDNVRVKESDKVAVVTVVRKDGLAGRVTCKYSCKDQTALAGTDYTPQEGELVFDKGVTQQQIQVPIMDDGSYEKTETFQVILSDVEGGASLEDDTDGGADRSICVVHILSDEVRKELVDMVAAQLDLNVDSIRMAASSWKEQAVMAVAFEGDSLLSSAGVGYLLALPWKVACAVIPPPRLAQGWVCFSVTLCLIGLLTALIGDLAAHTGCCIGLKPSVTAITFVALGTSLPDTFASKAAAVGEPHADNSIGNITGSNSVNVFLGLGLPWAIAAIYWAMVGSDPAAEAEWRARYAGEAWYSPDMPVGFAVPAGDLGFSVAVFTGCALVCLGVVVMRRAVLGMELGGPDGPKKATAMFFVFLWFVYIGLSSVVSSP